MRLLRRNLKPFWYANFAGKEMLMNEYDSPTGEYRITYTDPVKCSGNISAATGTSGSEIFGELQDYDRVILVDDPDLSIEETSVIWFLEPAAEDPYEYIVKKIARSLNAVSIAVQKVQVHG